MRLSLILFTLLSVIFFVESRRKTDVPSETETNLDQNDLKDGRMHVSQEHKRRVLSENTRRSNPKETGVSVSNTSSHSDMKIRKLGRQVSGHKLNRSSADDLSANRERHRPKELHQTKPGKNDNAKRNPHQNQRLSRNYRRKTKYTLVNSTTSTDVKTQCANVTCPRKQMCVVEAPSNKPLCVQKITREPHGVQGPNKEMHHGPFKHEAKEQLKFERKPETEHQEHTKNSGDETKAQINAKRRAQEMKDRARNFEERYEEFQDARKTRLIYGNSSNVNITRDVPQSLHLTANSTSGKHVDSTGGSTECGDDVIRGIRSRLLHLFKEKEDENEAGALRHKRSSSKKQLHEDDECICQSPVSWVFQQYSSADSRLSISTVKRFFSRASEPSSVQCLHVLLSQCDVNKDGGYKEKEWCCCFADTLPPCLSALKAVPHLLVGGVPTLPTGAYVPACDSEGFYKSMQCSSSTGQCWCADRLGNEIKNSRVYGIAKCEG